MGIIKDEEIKQQIKMNAIIVCILNIIFYIILCFFKKYSLSVVAGIIIGSSYSVLNFIFISISMEKLILIPKSKIRFTAILHYVVRYLLMGAVIGIVMSVSNTIDVFSFLVTLFFSKLAILIQAILLA